jgi:cytochrome b involved in lipid metabolism
MASAKTLRTIVAGFIVFLFFYLAVIPTGSSKKKKVIEEHPTQEETDGKAKKKVCPEEMYTMDDVKKHTKCSLKDTKNNDLWLVIDDKVYDVTPWSMYF